MADGELLSAQLTDERRNPVVGCLRENKRYQKAGIEIEHFLYRASDRWTGARKAGE